MGSCLGRWGEHRTPGLILMRDALWPTELPSGGLVAGLGVEPSLRAYETQTVCRTARIRVVPPAGDDPATPRVKAECSTVELEALILS